VKAAVGAERTLHFLVNVGGAGYHPAAWREPGADPAGFVDPAHFVRVARVAERGLFDAVLLPDIPVQQPGIARGPAATLEPTLVSTVIAAGTERIGVIPTVSTSLNHPYNLARRILSLDHASGGRAGWNAVTTFHPDAARNFGIDELPERADRYRRAAEFVEVATALWDSWEEGALLGDQENARFADSAMVHAPGHRGEFFAVRGPLNVVRSPQGRPVLVQAGASAPGIAFAAAHAEVVYASQLGLPGALRFTETLRRTAGEAGRDPSAIRVLPGLVPVVGSTEEEARRRFAELEARRHPDDAPLRAFAAWLGIPVEDVDLDAPLRPDELRLPQGRIGPEGFFASLAAHAAETRLPVRELLAQFLGGHRVVAGTPEQIADHVETWWRRGAVDGFTIVPPVLHHDLPAFVDHVVPVLQRRGLYRTAYPGTTLRANLGLPEPVNSFAAA
jgi:FMN-dependent oxidoreductase (nitrilotriacetate monooxygenase family)